jgi:hypothetical protein
MVRQAEISSSNINVLQGTYTRIDHSFEDQSILDMVNKELIIDSMQWEFDEDAVFNTFLDEIKTNTAIYPTPDWSYGEDRFFNLSFGASDDNIINDVKIMGSVYETQILVPDEDSGSESPYNQYQYETTFFSDSKSYNNGDVIEYDPSGNYTKVAGDFTLKILGFKYSYKTNQFVDIYIGNRNQAVFQGYNITSIDYTLTDCTFVKLYNQISAGPPVSLNGVMLKIKRKYIGGVHQAFSFSIALKGFEDSNISGEIPTQTDEDSPTYDYEYDQVAAHVEDIYSINKYGRRKPNSEGKIEFPLAENVDRCKAIGRKIIKDSHRRTKQPRFKIPFNPLLKVGQTISITDKKIGYSQRWYVEEVNHRIEQGKGRTRIGCVYYA